ncbi:MAG TPA: permease [Rhizomicrobium sp.]|nr:permease [Rhizomicrobium sp.]
MSVLFALEHALLMAATMGWEILWPLILGFALSGVVQAVVSHSEMARLLPDDRPRSILRALGLGAASSSCSYAAVALARAIFRKGGNFSAAMAFEMASTNLVLELGIVLIVLMGWQFAAAEFIGAPIMVAILVLLFRWRLSARMVEAAKAQADKGIAGRMEGHAAMDMSVASDKPLLARIASAQGFTAISHYFIMDVASLWLDIVLGLLIAGALAAWVPPGVWQSVFFVHHPTIARLWGPLVGPLVGIASFVCSVGNVPLAAVLWNGGISFGGVIAFLFSDLIVAPILDIYRKYYGMRMMRFLLGTFYAAMAGAALIVDELFSLFGLVPEHRQALVVEAQVAWNYTTWLNIVFLGLAATLLWRFFTTGGPAMLRMMGEPADAHHHAHHCH